MYHEENEQLRTSWPVKGGNSSESPMTRMAEFQVAIFGPSIVAKTQSRDTLNFTRTKVTK